MLDLKNGITLTDIARRWQWYRRQAEYELQHAPPREGAAWREAAAAAARVEDALRAALIIEEEALLAWHRASNPDETPHGAHLRLVREG